MDHFLTGRYKLKEMFFFKMFVSFFHERRNIYFKTTDACNETVTLTSYIFS